MRRVLVAVDEAMSAVAETRDHVAGQVAIAAFNMGIPTLAAPMMHRLSLEEPNLRVQVQQETSTAALRLLRQGEVDIAITCQYDFVGEDAPSGLSATPLLFEPLVLLAPTHSHLRIRKHGLGALADGPWVTGPQNSDSGSLSCAPVKARVSHRRSNTASSARRTSAIRPPPRSPRRSCRASVPAKLEGLIVPGLQLGGRTISAVVRPDVIAIRISPSCCARCVPSRPMPCPTNPPRRSASRPEPIGSVALKGSRSESSLFSLRSVDSVRVIIFWSTRIPHVGGPFSWANVSCT